MGGGAFGLGVQGVAGSGETGHGKGGVDSRAACRAPP
jgi:hypothetical protein